MCPVHETSETFDWRESAEVVERILEDEIHPIDIVDIAARPVRHDRHKIITPGGDPLGHDVSEAREIIAR